MEEIGVVRNCYKTYMEMEIQGFPGNLKYLLPEFKLKSMIFIG